MSESAVLYRLTIPGALAQGLGRVLATDDHTWATSRNSRTLTWGDSLGDARHSAQLVLDRAQPGDTVVLGLDQLGLRGIDRALLAFVLSTHERELGALGDALLNAIGPHLDPNPVDLLARLDAPLDLVPVPRR